MLTAESSILNYALSAPGTCAAFLYLSGASYNGGDLPNSNYTYGTAIVLKRSSTSINVIVFPEGILYKPIRNVYSGSAWSGWRDFAGAEV